MKRLRIVQQIIIVLLFAVLVPFIAIGLIISNVSQQSVRKELNYNVTQISRYIAQTIERHILSSEQEFSYIASAVEDMPVGRMAEKYLKDVQNKYSKYKNLKILPADYPRNDYLSFNAANKTIKLYTPIDSKRKLSGELFITGINELLNDKTNNFLQSIFVFDDKMILVAANNTSAEDLESILNTLPKERKESTGVLFSKIKNQPIAYYQLPEPDWTVVVMTRPSVTHNTIDRARGKIVACLLVAAVCIFFTAGLYFYYLYINIRQLFKGITAISKGSYDRKIRLLKSIFTPYEIVFLEKEFNYMTQKVSQGYFEISQKNIELKRLNEYRDSLVSAISHEFRTPLTSIIGYASRLMRQDIIIDDETKTKSLHIIKQQAQRLSRMVDDLLTIPDIESLHLSISPDMVDLSKIVELSVEYSNTKNTEFQITSQENLKPVYADYDRLIQIMINLCDNAVKYNLDNSPIEISMKNTDKGVEFKISNRAMPISPEMMEKIYDKFIRLETDLTRTTRGTGLGLYIVKGLSEAMNIDIKTENKDGFFVTTLNFKDNAAR